MEVQVLSPAPEQNLTAFSKPEGGKWLNTKKIEHKFPNLLLTEYPTILGKIWVSDFTLIQYYEKKVYLCTVMDLWN